MDVQITLATLLFAPFRDLGMSSRHEAKASRGIGGVS
jgi:hypothetical protein